MAHLDSNHMKTEVLKNVPMNEPFMVIISALGILLLSFFRNTISLELGIIAVLVGFYYEYEGVTRGWWNYNSREYKLYGKVPIGLLITYFFSTVIMVNYVVWRLGGL
jgi:hypothetical protein